MPRAWTLAFSGEGACHDRRSRHPDWTRPRRLAWSTPDCRVARAKRARGRRGHSRSKLVRSERALSPSGGFCSRTKGALCHAPKPSRRAFRITTVHLSLPDPWGGRATVLGAEARSEVNSATRLLSQKRARRPRPFSRVTCGVACADFASGHYDFRSKGGARPRREPTRRIHLSRFRPILPRTSSALRPT